MQRAAALALTLLLSSLALAGCLGDDAPAETASAAADAPKVPHDGPIPVDDGRGATADELGHQPHLHDYWLGRERVTLFEDTVEPTIDETFNATTYRVFFEKRPMVGGTGLNFPDGTIVYEGSGSLEVTATWTDPAVTSLGFSYRSAAGPDFSDIIRLESGKAATIDISPEMADLPHSPTSRWTFVFSPADAGAVMGPFDLKMDVVKVDDIAVFPGHPDLYVETDTFLVHDDTHVFDEVSYPRRTPNLILTGQFGETEVTPQRSVPMKTTWMHVEVIVDEATATPGEVTAVKFFFHGADRTYIDYPYLQPIEGSLAEKRLVYAFPVTPEMHDSPYAGDGQSQWRFFFEPQTSFTPFDGPCGGCADTHMKFRMMVTAHSSESEGPFSKEVQRGEG